MKLFACVKVYNRSFLLGIMSIDCDSSQRHFNSLAIGIPFILIIYVGIPLVLLYNVFSMKKRYSKNLNHILWSEYAYITKSYRTEVVMWESVLMIRNMGIAFLSVILLTQSLAIQILWEKSLAFVLFYDSRRVIKLCRQNWHTVHIPFYISFKIFPHRKCQKDLFYLMLLF